MHVTTIRVFAGRTFNHPHEQYSNFKPSLSLEATLAETDDVDGCVAELQGMAERMVEDHKTKLLADVDAAYQYQQDRYRLHELEREKTKYGELTVAHEELLESLRAKLTRGLPAPQCTEEEFEAAQANLGVSEF